MIRKHIKLIRKLAGSIARLGSGGWKSRSRIAKPVYLAYSWLVELAGDVVFFWKRHDASIKDPRRILIVKDDQLGDVLFSTMLLPALAHAHPKAKIDYLVNPRSVRILEGNPHVGEVYQWNDPLLEMLPGRGGKGGWAEMRRENRRTASLLHKNGYDAVINARAYPPSSNAPWKGLGGKLVAFDISERSFFADRWAEYDLDREEWRNYLELLRPFGIDPEGGTCEEEFYGFKKTERMGEGKYAVISPISFDKERRWSDEKWRELIAFLGRKGIRVALTGIPSQEEYLKGLVSGVEGAEGTVRICTGMEMDELGGLMKGACCFVGIDSFPAHLAIACHIPAFVFVNTRTYYLPGTSVKRFAADARSMIPKIAGVEVCDVDAEADAVEERMAAVLGQ